MVAVAQGHDPPRMGALAPLIILVVGLGVFPIPVLDLTQAPVDKILEYVALERADQPLPAMVMRSAGDE